jgi:hypothetical protein
MYCVVRSQSIAFGDAAGIVHELVVDRDQKQLLPISFNVSENPAIGRALDRTFAVASSYGGAQLNVGNFACPDDFRIGNSVADK